MNGHLEAEDMKRARTQYETHSSYPGMWTGRWTSASPSIKEEKAPAVPAAHQAHPGHQTPGPVTEIPGPPGQPGQQGSPGSGQSPYPATFHDTIVFSHAQPTTTSSDILYDSINISQAYPSLTSSLGKCALSSVQMSLRQFLFQLQKSLIPTLASFKKCCPLMLSASHLSCAEPPEGPFSHVKFHTKTAIKQDLSGRLEARQGT